MRSGRRWRPGSTPWAPPHVASLRAAVPRRLPAPPPCASHCSPSARGVRRREGRACRDRLARRALYPRRLGAWRPTAGGSRLSRPSNPAREVPAPPRRVALWKGSYHGNHENTLWLFRTIISFLLWFLLWLNLRFLLDVLRSVPCPRASARSVLTGRRPTRSRRSATLPRRWAYRGWLFGTGGW